MQQSALKPEDTENKSAEILHEVREFVLSRKLLNLASLSKESLPHASTAPFLLADGNFYLFISDSSEHTANLKANSHASIIFNADEVETKQPFARLRVTFNVQATLIDREAPLWTERMAQMREKFGAVVEHLQNLLDFHLFELKPSGGRYIKGFGEAYALDGMGEKVALHLQLGHKKMPKKQ
ncbi:MAG: pyridoxamine 5'-phosphate oxidase family protein [Gammaproteobacteria bacterium]|nr:pyridoxamine 5'-phosphate oxidase family protein [Gammaproteobacteria bacterium]